MEGNHLIDSCYNNYYIRTSYMGNKTICFIAEIARNINKLCVPLRTIYNIVLVYKTRATIRKQFEIQIYAHILISVPSQLLYISRSK